MKKFYYIFIISLVSGFVFSLYEVFGKSVDYKNNNDTTIVSDSLLVKIDSAIIIQQNLTDGKNIYNKKCGKCHILHETDEYTQKEWKKILKVMKEKAELTKEQHSLVLGYLYSKSKK